MSITSGQTALASDFVSTSAGAGDSGKVAKLNGSGVLDESFIDYVASGFRNFLGVGARTFAGGWHSFQLLMQTYTGGVSIWTTSGSGLVASIATGSIGSVSGSTDYFVTTNSLTSGVAFNSSKKLIAVFDLKFTTLTNGSATFGFVTAGTSGLVGTNTIRVAFDISSSNIYGSCATGSARTETALSGVTLTNMNHYRIEYDPANTQALFYVNGVLKATVTTNLPTASSAEPKFNFGCLPAGAPYIQAYFTAPKFLIEI